jgi:hypothetical protein
MKDTSQSSKGATADDAAALEELSACAAPIVEQNRHLARRAGCRDFNPSTELDFTSNGAGILIRRLFEAVALFDEGCVPWQRLSELFATTNALVNAIKLRKGAPVAEIDAVGVAFRECYTLWCDTHSPPRMERKTYLKQIFDGRNCVRSDYTRNYTRKHFAQHGAHPCRHQREIQHNGRRSRQGVRTVKGRREMESAKAQEHEPDQKGGLYKRRPLGSGEYGIIRHRSNNEL